MNKMVKCVRCGCGIVYDQIGCYPITIGSIACGSLFSQFQLCHPPVLFVAVVVLCRSPLAVIRLIPTNYITRRNFHYVNAKRKMCVNELDSNWLKESIKAKIKKKEEKKREEIESSDRNFIAKGKCFYPRIYSLIRNEQRNLPINVIWYRQHQGTRHKTDMCYCTHSSMTIVLMICPLNGRVKVALAFFLFFKIQKKNPHFYQMISSLRWYCVQRIRTPWQADESICLPISPNTLVCV